MDFINIKKLFSSDYYSVPDYQRDYEWTAAQNSTLLDDIFSVLIDSNKDLKHFIGAIVTVPYESANGINKSINFEDYSIPETEVRHIVDGQQRLTSLSIMISAVKDIIEKDSTIIDSIKTNLINVLTRMLLGDAVCSPDYFHAPRLILNGNTGYYYNKEILQVRNESANKKFRGAKHVATIYEMYQVSITKQCKSYLEEKRFSTTTDFYKSLVEVITSRLILVEITCDESSNAFQVFDSLNGKGLDLTSADRIKNIMLSWASPSEKAVQKWDALVQLTSEEYLANYFIALFFYKCGERVSKNKLPEEFRNVYKNSANDNYGKFFETLKETATLYGQIRNCNTNILKVDNILKNLQQLKLDQIYVLIFAVAYHYKSDNILNTSKFISFINALTSLVVRMQICDMSMNSLDVLFKKCIKEMKEANADISLITKIIEEKKKNLVPDDVFESRFAQFSTNDNNLSEFYLRQIEDFKRKEVGIRNHTDRGLSVEHIIPQTLDDFKEWYGKDSIPPEIEEDFHMNVIQNIGNKALLYGDDNTSAGNNNYAKKVLVYRTGKRGQDQGTPIDTFQMIKELVCKYPTKFNHEEVFDRAKELAACAIKIW